jgi:hypothetical protein
MNNLDIIKTESKKHGFEFICEASVWDFHNSKIGESKNSQIYKEVKRILDSNENIEKLWVIIASIGRSQHHQSFGGIFDATNADIENSGFEYTGTYFTR